MAWGHDHDTVLNWEIRMLNVNNILSKPYVYKILCIILCINTYYWDFPGGAVVKNPPANAGDTGSSPGPGRSHMPQSN